MAAFTMQLTDGTTTINFDGTDGYSLIDSSWTPQRAQRNESDMGPVYEDVIETIPIVITGGSHTHVMERYAALSDLLDQAEAWGQDDSIDTVLFKYQPNGSTLASPLEAVILGKPSSGRMLSAPSTTNEAGYRGNVLTPVIVSFKRRGELLGATEEKSSSESTDNPAELATAAFTDTVDILTPYDVNIAINRVTGSDDFYKMFILLQNAASKLFFLEGETFATTSASGGAWSTPAVAAASGGGVARYTFSGTGNTGSIRHSGVVGGSGSTLMSWYAMIDNDCDQDIKVYVEAAYHVSGFVSVEPFIIPSGSPSNAPVIYFLGTTFITEQTNAVRINIEVNDSSATATGTLDIDYVGGIVLDENSHIVELSNASGGSTDQDINIIHRLDEKLTPAVWYGPNGGALLGYSGYKGNASVHMAGNAVACLFFGQTGVGDYAIDDGSAGKADITLTATKTTGYLTPL